MTDKANGLNGTINLDIRDSKPDWDAVTLFLIRLNL